MNFSFLDTDALTAKEQELPVPGFHRAVKHPSIERDVLQFS
jgi:hypothetical protein